MLSRKRRSEGDARRFCEASDWIPRGVSGASRMRNRIAVWRVHPQPTASLGRRDASPRARPTTGATCRHYRPRQRVNFANSGRGVRRSRWTKPDASLASEPGEHNARRWSRENARRFLIRLPVSAIRRRRQIAKRFGGDTNAEPGNVRLAHPGSFVFGLQFLCRPGRPRLGGRSSGSPFWSPLHKESSCKIVFRKKCPTPQISLRRFVTPIVC